MTHITLIKRKRELFLSRFFLLWKALSSNSTECFTMRSWLILKITKGFDLLEHWKTQFNTSLYFIDLHICDIIQLHSIIINSNPLYSPLRLNKNLQFVTFEVYLAILTISSSIYLPQDLSHLIHPLNHHLHYSNVNIISLFILFTSLKQEKKSLQN